MEKKITIIGNAILDVLAAPVGPDVFSTGSQPVEDIRLSCGGDALNEAVVLARLGRQADLISKVGDDAAGAKVLDFLKDAGVPTGKIAVEKGLATSVNIVLIDEKGERHFLTNPAGSQRKLSAADILPHLASLGEIVSFASIFVSPVLDIPAMTSLFKAVKKTPGRVLLADLTKAKHGERLADMEPLLPYLDYILPNAAEIALLTGTDDPERCASLLLEAGVGCAVIKRGENGCLLKTKEETHWVPAYPVERCADTTGAGDSFAAGFLWALSKGWPLPDCGCFASAAASCTVEHIGAGGVSGPEEPLRRCRVLQKTIKQTRAEVVV